MNDRRALRSRTTADSVSRLSAAIGACLAVSYAVWQLWTAASLSHGAPLGWRLQLFLLEGGVPLLFALGCSGVAWGTPRLRTLGAWLIALTVVGLVLWQCSLSTPADSTVNAALGSVAHASLTAPIGNPLALLSLAVVAALDHATRVQRLEAAYRQYSDDLFAYAGALNTHPTADVAEDAVHDIFAALLTGQRDDVFDRDAAGVRAHLFSAVKYRVETVCRSERRHEARVRHVQQTGPVSVTAPIPPPDAQYQQTELDQRVRAELAACSPRGVEAFHLVHECGLSYAEAASVMGITPQAVGSHLSRIISRLRQRLHAWAPSQPVQRSRGRRASS